MDVSLSSAEREWKSNPCPRTSLRYVVTTLRSKGPPKFFEDDPDLAMALAQVLKGVDRFKPIQKRLVELFQQELDYRPHELKLMPVFEYPGRVLNSIRLIADRSGSNFVFVDVWLPDLEDILQTGDLFEIRFVVHGHLPELPDIRETLREEWPRATICSSQVVNQHSFKYQWEWKPLKSPAGGIITYLKRSTASFKELKEMEYAPKYGSPPRQQDVLKGRSGKPRLDVWDLGYLPPGWSTWLS